MNKYRWKSEYQNKGLVADYDGKRFHGIEGRIKNRRDWRALTKAMAVLPKDETILNIPCGTGRFFSDFAKTGYRMVAADVSHEMLEYARDRYGDNDGRIVYGRFDIENLPYEDNAVPCTLVFRLMHLINNEEVSIRILKEARRVTRDWLIVSFHHKYTVKYAFSRLRGKRPKGKMSYWEMKRIVDGAGLTLVKLFPTGYPFSSNWVALLKP